MFLVTVNQYFTFPDMVYTCVSFSAIQLLEFPKFKIERFAVDVDNIFIGAIFLFTLKRATEIKSHKRYEINVK